MKIRNLSLLPHIVSTAISLLAVVAVPAAPARGSCLTDGALPNIEQVEEIASSAVSLREVLLKVGGGQPTYLFVGERHQVGPVKRFVVDLANALVDQGLDVGLYVEGFRTDCSPTDASCHDLARVFGVGSFLKLLEESRAPVHPIDPPNRLGRTRSMADLVAAGSEAIRIVLVGNSHVLYAGDSEAQLWVYGGGMRYPDPGDLVEAFPRERSLTFALQEAPLGDHEPYLLLADGCRADYLLLVPFRADY